MSLANSVEPSLEASDKKNHLSYSSNLFCPTEDGWEKLPSWAEFCFELGKLLVSLPKSDERAVVGAALPTRAFAATFAAVGAIIGNIKKKKVISSEEYFQFLCQLPISTKVKIQAPDRKGKERLFEGSLIGCEEVKCGMLTTPVLKVQIAKSSMGDYSSTGDTRFFQSQNAHKIQLVESEGNFSARDLPIRQKGVIVTPINDFARQIIGKNHTDDFLNESYYTCLLVGNLGPLRQEIVQYKFATCFEGKQLSEGICVGNLLDFLRVRKFTSSLKNFHADAFASNSRRPPRVTQNSIPDVVIFDGASGFLKWRDFWKKSHWVVLLDQTESSFSDAANLLNNIYLQRTGSDSIPENFPFPPDQVELVYFQEKIK